MSLFIVVIKNETNLIDSLYNLKNQLLVFSYTASQIHSSNL